MWRKVALYSFSIILSSMYTTFYSILVCPEGYVCKTSDTISRDIFVDVCNRRASHCWITSRARKRPSTVPQSDIALLEYLLAPLKFCQRSFAGVSCSHLHFYSRASHLDKHVFRSILFNVQLHNPVLIS